MSAFSPSSPRTCSPASSPVTPRGKRWFPPSSPPPSRPSASSVCARPESERRLSVRLLLGLLPPRLVDFLHPARHDLAADAPLYGAAESRDLVGEGMAGGDHHGAFRNGQESTDGLRAVVAGARVVLAAHHGTGGPVRSDEDVHEDIGRLFLDERLEPEEILLHPGQRCLGIVEEDLLEGGQVLLQSLGGLAGLAQIGGEISGPSPSPIVGRDAGETGGAVGLVTGEEHAPQQLLYGLDRAAGERLEGSDLARAEIH